MLQPVRLKAPAAVRFAALSAGLLLAAVLASCNGPKAERPPEPGDVLVARIDGKPIWASDVKHAALVDGEISDGEPLDVSSETFHRVLEEVIDQKLMAAEARKKRLDKTDVGRRRLESAQDSVLADMLVRDSVDRSIDDDKVRALYEEQKTLAKPADSIHARMILVKTKEEAEGLMKSLNSGGSFEALAMERSIDSSTRFNGGDMGVFTSDLIPGPYAAALKDAKAGQLIGPVPSEGGFAILKVEERKPEQPPTLDEARPQIVRYLTYDQVRTLLAHLREGAKIERLAALSGGQPSLPEPANAPPASAPAAAEAPASSPAAAAPSPETPAPQSKHKGKHR